MLKSLLTSVKVGFFKINIEFKTNVSKHNL